MKIFLSHGTGNFCIHLNIELILQAAKDAEEKTEGVVAIPASDSSKGDIIKAVVENVKWQMDKDRKSTALKALQGHIWKEGYSQEKLKAEYVFKHLLVKLC